MKSVEVGVLYTIGPFKLFLVDQFTRESVPERHYVEPVDCGENIAFLLPYEIFVFASWLLEWSRATEMLLLDLLGHSWGVEDLDIFRTNR